MNRALATILTVLSFSFTSCVYNNPEFPDYLQPWIPYHINDTLTYTSNQDTIDFIVTDYYKNPSTSYTGLAMDVKFIFEASYKTNLNSKYNYKLEETYDNSKDYKISIKISDKDLFSFNPSVISDLNNDIIKIKFVSDTTIKNTVYQNIYVIQKDTFNSKPRISEIIKSETKGVIQFYDFTLRKKWNLENK